MRYGLVGVASNLAGYLAYLALTGLGGEPKTTMSALYVVGATVGYLGHRGWTFGGGAAVRRSLPRYLLAHGLGYALNLALLWGLHDRAGLPHQAVQAAAILAVAAVLYVVLGRYVFAPEGPVAR